MPDLTSSAIALIHRQLGSITARQLAECGISRRSRERLLEDRVLQPVGHSVYRVPDTPWTFDARLVTLTLQHPQAFITGATGAAIERLRRLPRASRVQLSAPHGLHIEVPNWVQLRQSNRIEPHHVRVLANGMRIGSLPRIAFDLAADVSAVDLLSVMEQMRDEKGVDADDFFTTAGELCGRRRPGSDTFAKALLLMHGGPPTQSHPELDVLRALQRRGIPVVPQVSDLHLPNGRRVSLDMAVPHVRWGVEVDIHPHHFGVLGVSSDHARDRDCHLIDWQIERVTPLDYARLQRTVEQLDSLYHARCEALARR